MPDTCLEDLATQNVFSLAKFVGSSLHYHLSQDAALKPTPMTTGKERQVASRISCIAPDAFAQSHRNAENGNAVYVVCGAAD